VAQRWRLERAAIDSPMRHGLEAGIGVCAPHGRNANVVVAEVGEEGWRAMVALAGVAGRAAGLAIEERQAALFCVGQGAMAAAPVVITRGERMEAVAALELAQGVAGRLDSRR